tara:strand:+ start:677 stop:1303 length:627 start_codon:yes stop_codon:yes gene_type:complete
MVYKNFVLRSLVGVFLLLIYFTTLAINYNLIFFLIIFLYIILFIEINLYFKKNKLLILLYLLFSLIFFINIGFDKENIYNFNYMLFIIITFDIFSYVVGSRYGSKKILKKISPNKTLEGLIGGIIFSLLFSISLIILLEGQIKLNNILFIIVIISFSFIGDIIESYFKRINSLKNSSNFLPGHGGFFDRFDSLIFSMIPYSVFSNILL